MYLTHPVYTGLRETCPSSYHSLLVTRGAPHRASLVPGSPRRSKIAYAFVATHVALRVGSQPDRSWIAASFSIRLREPAPFPRSVFIDSEVEAFSSAAEGEEGFSFA